MSWIVTASGGWFDANDPDASKYWIADVAYALAHMVRFNGHAGGYSVAQHSVLCAHVASTPRVAFQALMHDAHEAFLPDLPRPYKDCVPGWRQFEKRVESSVRRRFGLPEELEDEVREIDERMLFTEARDLLRHSRPWGWHREPYDEVRIAGDIWTPKKAYMTFAQLYEALGGVR